MKILWHSNAPWAGTGYGQQTRLVCEALRDSGHEVVISAYYGLQGNAIEWHGMKILPGSGFEAWGNDVIKAHAEMEKVDVVVSLVDLFVLDSKIWSELSVPWLAWVPIDCVGLGPAALERLKVCEPIAMSEFGADQMLAHDITPASMIYHAVDTEVFQPLDKDKCRDALSLDKDAYIVGMVMANKGDRKQYPLQLEAVRKWKEKNPDRKIKIFIHTEPTSQMMGWDMRELVKQVGLEGEVYSTNQYMVSVVPFDDEKMATLYNTFDVLMNVTAGEGFGVPIIEAQACGVPVLTQDVTAMPEITKYGYTVTPAAKGLASSYGWQYAPSVDDMVDKLEAVYRMANRADSAMGRQWVQDHCSVPAIAERWNYAFEELQKYLDDKKAVAMQVVP